VGGERERGGNENKKSARDETLAARGQAKRGRLITGSVEREENNHQSGSGGVLVVRREPGERDGVNVVQGVKGEIDKVNTETLAP